MNNVYGEVLVQPSTPTVVNGITVPERGGYSLKGVIVWCEYDCEIELRINVDKIGGGRISGSVQTLFLDFGASPYGIGERDVVSVIVTLLPDDIVSPVATTVKSTLLVEQL